MNAIMNNVNNSNVNNAAISAEMMNIINNMKVGYNVVPGLGVGYASDEADLERMKAFVLGTLQQIAARQQQAQQPQEPIETEYEEVVDEEEEALAMLEGGEDILDDEVA